MISVLKMRKWDQQVFPQLLQCQRLGDFELYSKQGIQNSNKYDQI